MIDMRIKTKYEILIELQEIAAKLMRLSLEVAAMEEGVSMGPDDPGPKGDMGEPGEDYSEFNYMGKECSPFENDQAYNNAVETINKYPWNPQSVGDFEHYHYLKGRIISTMKVTGRTSVPLHGPEPNWNLGPTGPDGPS